ncbi:MAG: NfeD family protein [Chlamydiales bacterium]|nr:NfeD family protein [Chlamydiales bacterium]
MCIKHFFICLFLCFAYVLQGVEPINDQLAHFIKYDKNGPNVVGYIGINKKSEIDQSTWVYVRSSLELYKKIKPAFIILDLNTPGGELFSAEQISDALRDIDINYEIPVVAFIDNWAISAGALLAYSCRFIGVTKDASMGAAEPVIPSASGELTSASEKVNSAFRTDLANRARFFERNPLLAEAMVDKDVILVVREGVITKLEKEDQILPSDEVINGKGKLLTMSSEELIKYHVADFQLLPTKLIPITESEKEEGKWPSSKELLFQYPFFKAIPNVTIVAYEMDWKSAFFAFLAKPFVSSLLFLGLLMGFYVEFSSGGFGLAAAIGVICLVLIILSSFSVQAVNWLELTILLLGLLFIAIEVFVVPGFGIPGILGIVLTIAGLFLMMLPQIGSFEFSSVPGELTVTGELFLKRLGWLAGTLVVGVILIGLLARFVLPRVSRFSRLVHSGEQESSQGYVAGFNVLEGPRLGSIGIAFSPLRPSGKVMFDDKVFDAMSEGGFIEKGTRIELVRFDGSRMIVRIL